MGDDLNIGVLSPLLAGPFFGRVLQGLAHHLATFGGRVIAVQTLDATLGDDYLGQPPFDTPVAWDQVAGFVSIINAVDRPYLEKIRALGKPIVMVSHEVPGLECPVVLPDNVGGIREVVNHLVEHGHTKIAFAGNISQVDIYERYEAYVSTLKERGLSADEGLLFVAPNNLDEGGEEMGRAILAKGAPCSAVVAGTDFNARGLMRSLQAAGLRLPADMAVVGFNDHDFAAQLDPPLATVRQRVNLLGEHAGRLIVDMVRGGDVPPGKYRVKTSFIARDSCGCPGTALPFKAGSSSPGTPAERLRDNMAAVLADPEVSPGQEAAVSEATAAICRIFEEAFETHVVPRQRLKDMALALHLAFPRSETVSAAVQCAQQYRREMLVERGVTPECLEALDQCLRDFVLALTGAELRASRETNESLQASLRNEYYISMDLARAQQSDPKSLAWLARTQARSACLGLWGHAADTEGAESAERVLEVASLYGPGVARRMHPGTRIRCAAFPPVEALTLEGVEPEHIVCVVPVRTSARDWGILAAVGPAAPVAQSGRDVYFQWAAMVGMVLDHEALINEMRLSEERYALAASAANDGLWDWDVAKGAVFFSRRWKATLGYDEDEIGVTPGEWLARVAAEDLTAVQDLVAACLRGDLGSMECEHRMVAKDGTTRWVLCRAVAVPGPGQPAARMVGSLTDITARKALEEQLRQFAMYDPLTGLPNRRLFMDRLARAVARAKRIPGYEFSVLFLDLDDFKVVNDSLGHVAGDSLLVSVARRIASYLRENDTAVRFGGDEFAVLLDNLAGEERLEAVVQRLQEHLAAPYEVEDQQVVVSATIGIATSAADYDDPEDVVRDADTAMYRAKSAGRGSYATFDESMHARALSRLRSEQELRQAIEHRRLVLYYQPVVLLGSHRVMGVEALVRWPHPERGLVGPDDFLPLAEDTGLIVPLGRWVLEEACRQVAAWRRDGCVEGEFRVGVNVSHREFWHRDFMAALDRAVVATGVDPSWLTIEVTEGVIMLNPDAAQVTLRQLHERGVHVYLDDFGTGYSSLEFVHRFPIDGLKVDKSFVARSTADPRGRELVRTIIMMARNLGMGVVAEGIEQPDQERTLRELRCLEGQGFLFARPAPAALVEGFLREAPAFFEAGG